MTDEGKTLEDLIPALSEHQASFLRARINTTDDKSALDETKFSRTSLALWKKQPIFSKAYTIVTTPRTELVTGIVMDLSNQREVQHRIRGELMLLSTSLPAVFKRLFNIALHGKDSDSIKAIDLLATMFGVKENLLSRQQLTLVQQNIFGWTKSSEENATDSNRTQPEIETTFREVPDMSGPLGDVDSEG